MMQNRRSFFTSLITLGKKGQKGPFFPFLPGFDETLTPLCAECEGFCVSACLEDIVLRSQEGVPSLNLYTKGCTFCEECAKACPYGCFTQPQTTVNVHLEILPLTCLAWNKTICRSCADVCNDKAITFLGLFHPEIDTQKCTGCGFCVGVCPSQAIDIKKKGEK